MRALLVKVFGRIEISLVGIMLSSEFLTETIHHQNMKVKWGLEKATIELKCIHKVKGGLTSMDDAKAICSAARRKYWKEFDILN